VSGTYPVEGRTVPEIRALHTKGERRLLADMRSDLPREFTRVVECATHPEPGRRYQSAGAMLNDLLEAQQHAPVRLLKAPRLLIPAVAGATAGLWLIGLITSIAYNNTVGRIGAFGRETVFSYWHSGFEVLLGVAVLGIVFVGAISVLLFLIRLSRSVTAPRAGRLARIASRGAAAWTRGSQWIAKDPDLFAQALVAVEMVAVIVWLWQVWPLLNAVSLHMSDVNPDRFAPLRDRHLRNVFGVFVPVFTVTTVACWIALLRDIRFAGAIGWVRIASGFALIVFVVLTFSIPYRLIYRNTAERVDFAGLRCYVIGADDGHVLIHCPKADPPRNRVVPATDPRIHRSEVYESIFTPGE
jgi:hypothetical protein